MTQAQHRVLVVEDEPDIRAVLCTLLQTANYRTVEVDTAARAEIEARSHKLDLLARARAALRRNARGADQTHARSVGPGPRYLVTEAGVGYRLVVPGR